MAQLSITGLYLSLLGLLYVVLALKVVKLRTHFKVGIGDGGQGALARAIRVHGNFAEYTPIVILLLACAELNGSHPMIIHFVGAAFFISRIIHSIGITKSQGVTSFRSWGMIVSFLSIIVLALENIRLFLFA
ncbi:glutathione S-transferase [Thalassotalea insulae]|uniref:Glutathione S-transferase n=1 Tax=Thalassotalea insulae TaxID=2056778 RepID=A0ABQ6GP58_9GAMM|nr:MAPEG family protein [Thalassotalea insulae]GLX77089.1 glutathione S-transferase [Thalassotalea insulae]